MARDDRPDQPLRIDLKNVRDTDDTMELEIAISNDTDRTLHYIGDVRAINYDPSTGHLRLSLTDRGREVAPGGVYVLPTFRAVEPGSAASFKLQLPRTIFKLAPTDPPQPEPVFEEQEIAEATDVEIEIGWSRTPYYPDVREKPQPLEAWEDDLARVDVSIEKKRRT